MDIRDQEKEGVILKCNDYKEQDKLLTFVSPAGPERVIARGARKPDGSLRAITLPYARVKLLLSPAKGGLSFLREGQVAETYVSLTDNLERFAYAAYLAELLLTVWPEGKASADLYYLLLAAYSLIKLDDDFTRTARFFELKLIQELGWLPDLSGCHACGRSLMRGRFYLSPEKGALLCLACGAPGAAPELSAGAVESMRRLLSAPLTKMTSIRLSAVIARELEAALEYYLEYYLEYRSKARRVLDSLLN